MSGLTAVQVQEVTALINARLGEFNVEGAFVFEPVTPGVARLVFDAINEWLDEGEHCEVIVHATDDVTAIGEQEFAEGWKAGYERGRAAMRYELGMAEQAGGWVGTPLTDEQKRDSRIMADIIARDHQDQIRADIRDHTAYPSLDDRPNGADVFAGVHPVAGVTEAEPLPELMQVIAVADDPLRYTNGVPTLNGVPAHTISSSHTELSPATTATLGPEHTVVTPIVPRRPRTLAEVDADEGDDVGDEPERGMGINRSQRARMEALELQQKAAAKAKLGEVTREQLITELRRQAMAGVMPTMVQFDTAKPAVWPKAQMLLKTLDTTWADLAREAGLKQVRR